ncbi:MAG: shikimate kinase [Granulicella sp.]
MIATEQSTTPLETASPVPPHLRRIVLTGFMGAGKSTVGRLLARRLTWNFLDLDAHLESRAKATIPELFAKHGEARFRQLESSALASALGLRATVIALGGGTPEILTNRLLIEQTPGTTAIFLDAPFETLFDRCVLQEPGGPELARPVLADPVLARARFAIRHPFYRRLACLTIQTDALTPEDTVTSLLESLDKITPRRR